VTDVAFVKNETESDHVPRNGGVPVNEAVTTVEPQEAGPTVTVALGLLHTGFAVMLTLRFASAAHVPRVSRTLTPTAPVDPAVIMTFSPIAVAGDPFVIVHVAIAFGCGATLTWNTVPAPAESGTSTDGSGFTHSPTEYGTTVCNDSAHSDAPAGELATERRRAGGGGLATSVATFIAASKTISLLPLVSGVYV
jgi:hypothetical protein